MCLKVFVIAVFWSLFVYVLCVLFVVCQCVAVAFFVLCQSCGTRGTQSKAGETEMVPSIESVEFRLCYCVVLVCCFVGLRCVVVLL